MQKKTLLYIFAIAAFLGLVIGAGFFANELRIKIRQGPDKSQFEASQGELLDLSAISKGKAASQTNSGVPSPNVPKPSAALPQEPPAADSAKASEEATAKAAEEKAGSFYFAILGDTQSFKAGDAAGGFQKAVKNIEGKNTGLVMTVGDLLSSCDGKSGCEKKYGDWKNTLGSLSSKTYEVMGNHDRTGGDKADMVWQKVFELPQNGPEGYSELAYSFDYENSHFVVLNSESPDEHVVDKQQRDWLEKNLTESKKDNTFVFFHEPAYPVSSKIGESLDVEKSDRDALWKILQDKKVTAVFNGHEHINSRRKVDGVQQFVFGNTDSFDHDLPKAGVAEYSYKGKHYGLVEVKGKEVTVNVYSVDGNLLDSYKLPS